MPIISQFLGIYISMFWNDHAPPHVHIRYNRYKAQVAIETGEVLAGSFPQGKLRKVQEWVSMHHQELLQNWELAQSMQSLMKIEPLP